MAEYKAASELSENMLAGRLRNAVQFCKDANGMSTIHSDRAMDAEKRMVMERCLTENFLLKFGMDFFGKRDLLYIDMRGDQDIARMYDMGELPRAPKAPKEAPAGGDDDGGDDDDE